MTDPFAPEADFARSWLFDAALPLWWANGADRTHGGWYDKLDQQGHPVDAPKRARVQGRQSFVYAQAGRLGWDGPWQEAVVQGLDYLFDRYRRPDGLFRKTVTVDGRPLDDDFDIYDQAFVLLGLASAYESLGRPAVYKDEAEALVTLLGAKLAHPQAGFEEAVPRRLPLRSNPHMHLLEALLHWVELGGGKVFRNRAAEIVELATSHMIDASTGAMREYFDGEWRQLPGDEGIIREPGHQFEWAFLLGEAARVLGGDHRRASDRLERFGATYGIDPARQVAYFSMDAAGRPIDLDARLWSQSERVRTSLILGRTASRADASRLVANARAAFATLRRFLDVPVAGLWLDRMHADGQLVVEPAPASSFYHIVTGLLPLIDSGYARAG